MGPQFAKWTSCWIEKVSKLALETIDSCLQFTVGLLPDVILFPAGQKVWRFKALLYVFTFQTWKRCTYFIQSLSPTNGSKWQKKLHLLTLWHWPFLILTIAFLPKNCHSYHRGLLSIKLIFATKSRHKHDCILTRLRYGQKISYRPWCK